MSVNLSLDTLDFPRPLTQSRNRLLTISNPNDFPVAFKLMTTNREGYLARPNKGKLGPGEHATIIIMLYALVEDPPMGAKCKDKFLIQSCDASPHRDKGFSEIFEWSAIERRTHSQKLRVRYISSKKDYCDNENDWLSGGVPAISTPQQINKMTVALGSLGISAACILLWLWYYPGGHHITDIVASLKAFSPMRLT